MGGETTSIDDAIKSLDAFVAELDRLTPNQAAALGRACAELGKSHVTRGSRRPIWRSFAALFRQLSK
jgi:hypothetical protein